MKISHFFSRYLRRIKKICEQIDRMEQYKYSILLVLPDVDECTAGVCNQGCRNTYGSYQCVCNTGYQLGDQHTCNGTVTRAVGTQLPMCV